MAKLTLTDVAAGYNQTTTINANNAATEAAVEKQLSRDGTSPNQMEADLDMNSYNITNVGNISNSSTIQIDDGVSAPDAVVGKALIYVDSADGDLKVKFGDGTVATIATDT